MNLALVYDRINKFGGAEQVLLGLHDLWPKAPLYTAFYSKNHVPWARDFKVYPSFANSFPLASTHHELYPWLAPFAFESFNFDNFDVVLSVTSAEAKSVITKPDTCHICYCLTPTRYLWSGYETYRTNPFLGPFLSLTMPTLRTWDKISSSRPDYYIAISSLVKKRIENFYEREVSAVIHPPVNTDMFAPKKEERPSFLPSEYFLVVSRLVGYKRIDLLIQAFNKMNVPLVIIGDGRERKKLQSLAGSTIHFITEKLTEERLAQYYRHCTAFVYAAEEDFGIAAAEAQASGKVVIAYAQSGVADIVVKETGVLFEQQTVQAIIEAVKVFEQRTFNASLCRSQALQFSRERFQEKISTFIKKVKKL